MTELISADSEQLCIGLSGRIDSLNAEEVREMLAALRAGHPQGKLVLSCEGLQYISSAGLRVLLALQKKEKQRIVMQKLNPEVIKILTVTGFHKLLLIEKEAHGIPLPNGTLIEKISAEYAEKMAELSFEALASIEGQLREIDIAGAQIVGKGTTGCVYRLGDEDIVKVYNRGISLATVLKELMSAKKAFVSGIPTAISYDVVKVGECYGAVFEMILGESLAQAMGREPEYYDHYAAGYADLFKKLHSTTAEANAFPSAKMIFAEAAERCTKYYSETEIGLLKKIIAGIPDRNTLVHRDYHPRNIMVSDRKLLLIDMADVCIGSPVFDWMGIIATHQFFGGKFPEAVKQNMGLSPEECSRLKNRLFHLYFPDKDATEMNAIMGQAELYSKLLLGISPALRPEQNETVNRICVAEAREHLLPHAEEITEKNDMGALFYD